MTSFTTHTVETAPQEAKATLENVQGSMGFVPNIFAKMAEAPALLEGYLALSGFVDKTSFTETERQIVLMTNNIQNGCTYCMAAHTTISQMKGVEAEVVDALRNQTALPNAKFEALREFAKIVNETRGTPSAEQMQAFFGAGYTQQHVLEIVLATALKTMSNYTNHIVQTPLDEAFLPNRWSADSANAA